MSIHPGSVAAVLILFATPVYAQRVKLDPPPRRQFVTVWIEMQEIQPLHFKQRPLEQLVGASLNEVQDPFDPVDYRTEDGATQIDVIEFKKRTRGAGITVYPFGAGRGATLALRVSRENLPILRFDISRPGRFERYTLTDGRATDFGIGVFVNDRPRGWGLGAHSSIIAGYGKLKGERGPGTRYFAEGGGGVSIGPFGVDLAVKFAYNKLADPRPHAFYTVPICVRGTLTF